jgi:hypothetical protein
VESLSGPVVPAHTLLAMVQSTNDYIKGDYGPHGPKLPVEVSPRR